MTKNEKRLLVVNALYFLSGTMSGVFVNVYLYAFTGSLVEMTIYAMVRFGFFPLGFLIGGFLGRRSRLATSLTIGLVIIIGTLGFLLFLTNLITTNYSFIYLIGGTFGIGEGMYWFSVSNLGLAVSEKKTRAKFVTTMSITNSISTVLAPSIAALIVSFSSTDTQGYLLIFQLVIILHTYTAYLSSKIDVAASKENYTLLDKFKIKNDSQWRYMMISHLLFGIRDSATLVIMGLLLYNALGSVGSLYSTLLIVFSVLGIVGSTIVRKVQRRDNRLSLYTYGAFALFGAAMVLVLSPNLIGALIYGTINALAAPFFINPYSIIVMNAMQDYMEKGSVYGHMIIKEVMLNVGRLIGMGFILVAYAFLPETLYMAVAVFCSAIFAPILVLYAGNYHRQRDHLKQV
jgi:MFS transporter, YQGE family, putative transporter